MSKTAEEILREVYSPSEPYSSAVIAMEDFAAQEVEAYKRRLIAEIRADVKNSGPTMLIGDIALLIDTVK